MRRGLGGFGGGRHWGNLPVLTNFFFFPLACMGVLLFLLFLLNFLPSKLSACLSTLPPYYIPFLPDGLILNPFLPKKKKSSLTSPP